MKAPRIVVVGSSNVDMVIRGPRLPAPGETVTGGRFFMVQGGKGANQAVAAARLGADVTFIAKVGNDPFGTQALAAYQQEGILTDHVSLHSQHATGVALIVVDSQGENLIAVAAGANAALQPEDIERAAERIRGADRVLVQLEVPLATVCCTAQLAFDAGVPVILDPAPVPAEPLEMSLLRHVDLIKPNETEAERLTGIRVHDPASALQAAARLLALGVRRVVITLGAQGACWATPAATGWEASYNVKAIDSTAAGDAFAGALACALGRGESLPAAVRYANRAASLSVTRAGAQPSLPTAAEVEAFETPV